MADGDASLDTPKVAEKPVAGKPAIADAQAPDEMLLEEFCSRLSGNDKRVELVNGFYFDEKQAGHIKGTEVDFKSRFDEFVNKPV